MGPGAGRELPRCSWSFCGGAVTAERQTRSSSLALEIAFGHLLHHSGCGIEPGRRRTTRAAKIGGVLMLWNLTGKTLNPRIKIVGIEELGSAGCCEAAIWAQFPLPTKEYRLARNGPGFFSRNLVSLLPSGLESAAILNLTSSMILLLILGNEGPDAFNCLVRRPCSLIGRKSTYKFNNFSQGCHVR